MDFAAARRTMVENQLRTYDVTDAAVLEAFESVPREAFVPAERRAIAYLDKPLSYALAGRTQTMLAPMVLARLLQAAEVARQDHVLAVGCGLGYAAALLATLAETVVALVEDEETAAAARAALAAAGIAKVAVSAGDLAAGAAMQAPFSLIVIEGQIEVEPTGLLGQLADRGRLVCIEGSGAIGEVVIFRKHCERISRSRIMNAAAPLLPAFRRPPAFVF